MRCWQTRPYLSCPFLHSSIPQDAVATARNKEQHRLFNPSWHASPTSCRPWFPASLCLQEAVATARDKERRKRRVGQPLLVPGLCLPKALQPVLPIYLQGVLQVRFICWLRFTCRFPGLFDGLAAGAAHLPAGRAAGAF